MTINMVSHLSLDGKLPLGHYCTVDRRLLLARSRYCQHNEEGAQLTRQMDAVVGLHDVGPRAKCRVPNQVRPVALSAGCPRGRCG